MPPSASPKILIVGAGPTGLTAAAELARRGLLPTVIDAKDGPSPLSRAVGITPRSLEHLHACGASDKIIVEGVAMKTMRIYRGDRLAMAFPLNSDRAFFPTLIALPQDRTEAILADRLRWFAGDVSYGRRLVGLVGGGPVIARFDDGTEDRFDIVIGADGVDSTVRSEAGIAFRGRDLDETWSISDVELKDWPHPGDFTVGIGPDGLGVAVPLGGTRYRLVSNTPNARTVLDLPVRIAETHREGTFRVQVRQAIAYAKGSIVLAGDAAHTHSPVGGRGMNTGIADAAVLADCIARGRIADYPSLRRPVGRKVIRETETARKLMTGANPLSTSSVRPANSRPMPCSVYVLHRYMYKFVKNLLVHNHRRTNNLYWYT